MGTISPSSVLSYYFSCIKLYSNLVSTNFTVSFLLRSKMLHWNNLVQMSTICLVVGTISNVLLVYEIFWIPLPWSLCQHSHFRIRTSLSIHCWLYNIGNCQISMICSHQVFSYQCSLYILCRFYVLCRMTLHLRSKVPYLH